MKFVTVGERLIVKGKKENIMQKDDLLLVKDGTVTEISSSLMAVAQKIEDYCARRVKTNIHINQGILNVRFELSYGRYIEYETLDDCFTLSINGEKFYVLRVIGLSHYSRTCLVMQIMRNVFGIDLELEETILYEHEYPPINIWRNYE